MHQINNYLNKLDYLFIAILFLFSFAINWNFAKFGVFPIDSFYHYDTGYRITKGEFPVKDYWVTTGIFVDFIEAFFFSLFGANWFSHVFHSSIFNSLITILIYFTFVKFNLEKKYSFIFSFLFGVLAYTPSGTPFVDHHATFFLLAGTIFFALGMKTKIYLYWFLAPWFYGFSFLCKQVPFSYMAIVTFFVLVIYFFHEKDKKFILYTIISSLFFLSFICLIIFFLNIGFKNFYVQYLLYPPSIGGGRLGNFEITFISFFNHYKFIVIPLLMIVFLNFKNQKENIFPLLLILSFAICLIFHQILTKNQIYIYFLSPFLIGFLIIEITKKNYKFKNSIVFATIIAGLLITLKYHDRFNEKRKFHELFSVDMSKSQDSSLINKKLSGFKWITSEYKDNSEKEVILLKLFQKKILDDKRKKMVITHYLFLSSLLEQNLNSPSRSFTLDGASFPIKGNKYFLDYKEYFNSKIEKENIEVIYIMDNNISENVVLNYLEKKCIKKVEKDESIIIFSLNSICFN